jgi:cob(I)alamin adenosyltransferase
MKNIVAVLTGNGKGKTTSAVGQAVRYVGAGKKVLFVQFFKKGDSSEIAVLRKIGVEIIADSEAQIPVNLSDQAVIARQLRLFKKAAELSGRYHAVFLDEFNLLASSPIADAQELKSILDYIKKHADIYITGRDAPDWVVEYADTVSIIINIKHHYDAGISAEKGREY